MVRILCMVKDAEGNVCTADATKYFFMAENLPIVCCASHVPEGAMSYNIAGAS